MSHKDIIQDVTYGNVHKNLLSGLSKEDMIAEYAKWAPHYDVECERDQACHKEVAAKALIESMNKPGVNARVLDAACGTGIVAEWLKCFADQRGMSVEITGVDFSPDMLSFAAKKNIYSQLLEGDLAEELDLEENSFDAFLAVGLFLDGHCGPEILPKLTRYVKPGGIGVITVRKKTYDGKESEYLMNFKAAKLSIVRNFVTDYLVGVEGNYIILKKDE